MPALIWPPAVSFGIALALLPVVRRRAHEIGLLDVPDAVRHRHPRAVPRLGGLVVVLAYLAGLVMLSALNRTSIPGRLADLASCAVLVFAAGLFDDWRGLPPGVKLSVILIAATLAAASSGFWPWEPALMAVAVVGITAVTIAFNLIDGVDGLAAAVGLVTAGVLAAASDDPAEVACLLSLAGALLAFLRVNWTPASLFLGDGGSLTIGFLLAVHAWFPLRPGVDPVPAEWSAAVVPATLFAVPLFDLTWAIVRRTRQSRPVFAADRGHLHHRLLDRGWGAGTIALTLAVTSGAAGFLAIAVERGSSLAAGVASVVVVILFIACFVKDRRQNIKFYLSLIGPSSRVPKALSSRTCIARPGAD